MGHVINLPKLSADIERAILMPDGPEKSALTQSIMLELSFFLATLAGFAETIETPDDPPGTN